MNKLKIITTIAAMVAIVPLFAADASAASAGASEFSSVNILLGIVAFMQLIGILSLSGTLKNLARKSGDLIEMKNRIEVKSHDSSNALKTIALLVLFSGLAGVLRAQEASGAAVGHSQSMDTNTLLLIIINSVLFLVFLYVVRLVYQTIAALTPADPEKVVTAVEAEEKREKQSVLSKVLVDAVPIEDEADIMLDHEYDGIHELDNNLPPWWVWMFYATIIFAFVYLAYYWILPYGLSQQDEYLAEVHQAELSKEAYLATVKDKVDENTVVFMDNPSDIGAGKKIYNANCMACHAADGGGGVGPNLTDEYWIHGGSVQDIFKTIKYGVPTKGMISWEAQLNPKQISQVTSYIHTLNGTTPAAPKEAQGEIWQPNKSEESVSDSLSTEGADLPKQEPTTPES